MSEGKIYHLSYVSTACSGLKYDQIKEILDTSNRNNPEAGISGILIYCNNLFFQILEGSKEDVEELFMKISIDPRHDNIIKLHENYIEKRQFDHWSMGFKSYNKELKMLDNFNTEEFYSYVNHQMNGGGVVSIKILADFFDLNG